VRFDQGENLETFFGGRGNPFYLQSVLIHSFSKLCKNMYTVACRRVLTSAPL
jgi:hypothetical protein